MGSAKLNGSTLAFKDRSSNPVGGENLAPSVFSCDLFVIMQTD